MPTEFTLSSGQIVTTKKRNIDKTYKTYSLWETRDIPPFCIVGQMLDKTKGFVIKHHDGYIEVKSTEFLKGCTIYVDTITKEEVKMCVVCGENKVLSEYYTSTSKKGIVLTKNHCKDCEKIFQQEYYQKKYIEKHGKKYIPPKKKTPEEIKKANNIKARANYKPKPKKEIVIIDFVTPSGEKYQLCKENTSTTFPTGTTHPNKYLDEVYIIGQIAEKHIDGFSHFLIKFPNNIYKNVHRNNIYNKNITPYKTPLKEVLKQSYEYKGNNGESYILRIHNSSLKYANKSIHYNNKGEKIKIVGQCIRKYTSPKNEHSYLWYLVQFPDGFLKETHVSGLQTGILNKGSHKKEKTNPEEKACKICGEIKGRTEFYKSASCSDGLSSYCKVCQNEKSRVSHNNMTEEQKERRRARSRKNQATNKEQYTKKLQSNMTRYYRIKKENSPLDKTILEQECPVCKVTKPLTKEYWYHDWKVATTNFQSVCKICRRKADRSNKRANGKPKKKHFLRGKYVLYHHVDSEGKLLYVGQSTNLQTRTSDHNRNSSHGKLIAKVLYTLCETKEVLNRLEAEVVIKEQPLYNKLLKNDLEFYVTNEKPTVEYFSGLSDLNWILFRDLQINPIKRIIRS